MPIKQIGIYFFLNLKLIINLDGILDKNFLIENRLISLISEVMKSITKTDNKIQECKIYNKITNNTIYSNR